ncbi:hypothetical protein E0H82_01185 [Acinetobacter sp. ANC 4910]|uniref:hypothetical protein n=1 Tax=Acinetobacter sp. ANC 4910 TaxID=2529850 RepID=UPI00103A6787|nr:hypothetical protein [Acinetobacter sp. ANC 4910]TCB38238.1 hypothetical protein E0H82_01185 [Acinetobacter sp. ANC 4910]
MGQKLIQFGFDIHFDMSLDEIIQALRFCPISYDVEQLDYQRFFFKVENSYQKNLILNFLSDFRLRQELNKKISPQQKSFVDAIILASISK